MFLAPLPVITRGNPLRPVKLLNTKDRIWRRGWDSHQCWELKTKNLQEFSFLTIRQIRTKALAGTRIEHAEFSARCAWAFFQDSNSRRTRFDSSMGHQNSLRRWLRLMNVRQVIQPADPIKAAGATRPTAMIASAIRAVRMAPFRWRPIVALPAKNDRV